MKKTVYNIKIIITALAVICLFACNDNLGELRKMSITSNEPLGEVKNMLAKHTDSGMLKVTISGKTMRDFSNDYYPYTEFPDGVRVVVYNNAIDSTQKTVITANYGVMYNKTKLVDLQGSIKIVAQDSTTFTGEQLYWDQKAEWLLTDLNSKVVFPNGSITTSERLDSGQKFQNVRARNTKDIYKVAPQQ